MVAIITGKTPNQEARSKWRTFNLVDWIRARRLQWAGHILRLGEDDGTNGVDRKIKQTAFEMFSDPQDGDLLMDVPKAKSWRELKNLAKDREAWREKVR